MRKLAITTLALGALAMGFSARPAKADVTVSVTIRGFYDELAPHGRWVNCRYGRCWVPRRVARHWQPYTNGRWVYTEYGWTWVSRDPWGGSPYHYGTWTYLREYGWSWVPGTIWAPAWVTWSYSDRYVGWAPLPPSVVFGESGYSGRPVVVSQTQYVFVPTNRFVDTDVTSVRVSAQESATIFRQTKPMTHFGVSDGIVRNTGIPMETIQRATGGRVETRNISAADTAPRSMMTGGGGRSRQVSIVAPAREVNAAVAGGPREASRPAPPSRAAKGSKAPINHESTSARPPSRQEPTAPRAEAKPVRRQEAAPAQSHGQPARAAPAERQEAPPAHSHGQPARPAQAERHEAPPAQSHGQPARAAPPERQEAPPTAQADPGARPAPAPAAKAAPRQDPGHEKPAKDEKAKGKDKEKEKDKDKDKDKDKKDEKH